MSFGAGCRWLACPTTRWATGTRVRRVAHPGGIDAIRNIVRRSGFKGLYYGLFPNLLKVAPSMGTSFFTYELVRNLLLPYDP